MPSSQEITELIDNMSGKIAYWQAVREDATKHIDDFMSVRTKLVNEYMNDAKGV